MKNKKFSTISLETLAGIKGASDLLVMATSTISNATPLINPATISDTFVSLTNVPAGDFAVRVGPPPPPGPRY
jgi:hypothetical protein